MGKFAIIKKANFLVIKIMLNKLKSFIVRSSDVKLLGVSASLGLLLVGFLYVGQLVRGDVVNLSVTVGTSLTFSTASNQFAALTPGTFIFSTTTLYLTTNDIAGWNVTLSKNAPTSTMTLNTDGITAIPDQIEWVPGAATSTTGNAVIRTALNSSGNVLAFRVMTASSSNGAPFYAPTWWGTTDVDGTAKWAGFASNTIQRMIGNAGANSYSASVHINTVQYYINVPASQPTGTYTGNLTYTAVGN